MVRDITWVSPTASAVTAEGRPAAGDRADGGGHVLGPVDVVVAAAAIDATFR